MKLDCLTPNEEAFFGANDSETIQAAIEAACRDGSRKIRIPRYNARRDADEWRIPVSIKIPDHFTVYLDNCFMIQETGVFDVMFTNSLADEHDLITRPENEQKDIALIGLGNVCLDGGKHNRCLEKTTRKNGLPGMYRNNMLFWANVNGLTVENIHIQHQRFWAINHLFCSNVTIRNINFFAIPHAYNMDGIDLRSGNHHFVIENITGRTGDDVVALTNLNGRGEAEYIVEGKDPDIHDVKIRNIQADPNRMFCLRLLNHDTRKIYNIDVDTIMDTSDYAQKVPSGSCLAIGSPIYYKYSQAQPGDTRNIRARNITSRSNYALCLCHTVEDTVISNVKTFGDNANGIHGWWGYPEPTQFKNVTIEHFFYDSNQQEVCISKDLPTEKFKGAFLSFGRATGDLRLKDVHIGKARYAYEVGGDLKITVEGEEHGLCYEYIKADPEVSIIVDGKEQNHG